MADGSRSDDRMSEEFYREALNEVFYQGVVAPTSRVLTTPSSDLQKNVATLAQSFDIEPLLEQVGIMAATHFATELESYALRPSDFEHLDLSSTLAARIANKIRKSDRFSKAFREQMKGRG